MGSSLLTKVEKNQKANISIILKLQKNYIQLMFVISNQTKNVYTFYKTKIKPRLHAE